jgi:hypothetical protein
VITVKIYNIEATIELTSALASLPLRGKQHG